MPTIVTRTSASRFFTALQLLDLPIFSPYPTWLSLFNTHSRLRCDLPH